MMYLILALVSSMLVSVCMRLGEGRAKNNISMLATNYAMCSAMSLFYAGSVNLFPAESGIDRKICAMLQIFSLTLIL